LLRPPWQLRSIKERPGAKGHFYRKPAFRGLEGPCSLRNAPGRGLQRSPPPGEISKSVPQGLKPRRSGSGQRVLQSRSGGPHKARPILPALALSCSRLDWAYGTQLYPLPCRGSGKQPGRLVPVLRRSARGAARPCRAKDAGPGSGGRPPRHRAAAAARPGRNHHAPVRPQASWMSPSSKSRVQPRRTNLTNKKGANPMDWPTFSLMLEARYQA
jgi:hypothetical protein